MKRWEKLLLGLCVAVLVALVGCATVQDVVTPCMIEKEATEYANEPAASILPWPTLYDAARIEKKIDYVHQLNQIILDRQIEDDNLRYAYILDAHHIHRQNAQQLRDNFFDPEGPLRMLLPAGLGLILGGQLIPRAKDRRRIDELVNGKQKTENNA